MFNVYIIFTALSPMCTFTLLLTVCSSNIDERAVFTAVPTYNITYLYEKEVEYLHKLMDEFLSDDEPFSAESSEEFTESSEIDLSSSGEMEQKKRKKKQR